MDDKERRALGAHYTSEQNILKVVQPLFLDELYIEFDAIKHNKKKLQAFHDKLTHLTFLDPACGCGNFLVVAYRELRRLEHEIIKIQRKGDLKLSLYGAEEVSKIQVTQFYGIEIEEFPSQVARLAMYLVDHQMNQELSAQVGGYYARIPLREPATIVHADALDTDWGAVIPKENLSYILGNPPFIGSKLMSDNQRAQVVREFGGDKGVGVLDFVTAWYAKAATYIQQTDIRVAFVSTNSIAQGEQVGLLWKNLTCKNIHIQFAHQTFKWNNDTPGVAAVYCVIIGFGTADVEKKYLYEYETVHSEPKEKEARNINPYLVAGVTVLIQKRSKPLCDVPEMSFGNMPLDGGHLLLSEAEKVELVQKEPEAEKYIKELISAKEFLNNQKRYCLWLEDVRPEELKRMPFVLERVSQVKKFREGSIAPSTQKFAVTPTLFRDRNNPESGVVIPSTSSENRHYIPIGFFRKNHIVSNSCHMVANATLYHFGILTSLMHMAWVSYTCGRLESRYRYSKDIVYNNFPWPKEVSHIQEEKIRLAAQKVLDARSEFEGSSLADLYNPLTMPPALAKAHNELDRAVDSLYEYKSSCSQSRIEYLFELYTEYTK
jgi:hypothetical protein